MKSEIIQIGIIGKGKMGTDIFNFLAYKNAKIIWICRNKESVEKLKKTYMARLEKQLKCGTLTEENWKIKKESVKISHDLNDLNSCDLITESVVENLEIKQDVFRHVGNIVSTDCLVTTNSTLLPLKDIFAYCPNKKRCFGLHFFYPVMLINSIEINAMPEYDPKKYERLSKFVKWMGKNHILLVGSANFVFSKIYIALIAYAYRIYSEKKADINVIDNEIKNEFLPLGLLSVIDSVGAHILLKACNSMLDSRNFKLITPLKDLVSELIELGYTGQKKEKGFLDYVKEKCNGIGAGATDEYRKYCILRLKIFFINECYNFVKMGQCTVEQISEFSKSIFGLRQGLEEMKNEIGVENVRKILKKLYETTDDEIYKSVVPEKSNNKNQNTQKSSSIKRDYKNQ